MARLTTLASIAIAATIAGAATLPDLSRLAIRVHENLQQERSRAGSPVLSRERELDRTALALAREVAARPEKQRLRGSLRALERAEDAGARGLGTLDARVFLMRGSTTPADEVIRQWRVASDSWSRFLDPETERYGLAASRASDGWIVVVTLVGRDAPSSATSARMRSPTPEEARATEARVHSLVLDQRRRRGLPPLVRDGELDRLARLHSLDMVQSGRLSHRGRDGSDVAARASRHGIAFLRISENVALIRAEDAAARAVEGWMESPGHRANVLDAAVSHSGVGVAWSTDGSFFFTQVFMRPPRGR